MKFKIPLTFSDAEILKRRSKSFIGLTRERKGKLDEYLKNSSVNLDGRQYLSICYRSFLFNFITFSVIFTSILGIFKAQNFILYGTGASLLISLFIFFNHLNYPKIYSVRKSRDIEKNLISALQDILVQLNSGVPIFKILINISNSEYGEVSEEFKKIVKEINSGISQIEAIEKCGKTNTSEYFKRVLWQISNGMRAGSDMGIVIKEGVKNLTDEQEIQIQNYGSRLNPLVMFYMLITVILPALGITFFIVISSIMKIPSRIIQLIFFLLFGAVVFIQIMFLGLIRSRRPSLL